MRGMSLALILALLVPLARAQYAGSTAVEGPARKGFDLITAEDCKTWLTVLASDEFEGRETGFPGYQKAAEYVAARFKEFGLEPVQGSYFQNVPFIRTEVSGDSSLSLEGGDLSIPVGDRLAIQTGEKTKLTREVVFISVQNANARVPDPNALRDKIVVISLPSGKPWYTMRVFGQIRRRAAAVLRVQPFVTSKPRVMPKWKQRGRRRRGGQINGVIAEAAAHELAKAFAIDVKYVDHKSAGDDDIHIHESKKKLTLDVTIDTKEIQVPNVVGLVKGSDPKLRDEVVICGSHLDHIGKGTDGEINNGADDDGSGSTALLAVAKAMGAMPKKPRRSVMFIAVTGEEKGLLGSEWYVEHPLFPIEKTVCELQMDMVGRNESSESETAAENERVTHLVGSKRLSMQLHETILELNKHVGFTFEYDEERVYTRSDHYNFAKKGIPVAFFFSGFHPDYHRPTDTIEKINFEKIANTAKLVFLTAFKVADDEKRLTVDEGPLKTP